MPKLLFSGFILDRQHGCTGIVTGSNPQRVRQAAPATTGCEMRRVFYTEFMLGAPVGRGGCSNNTLGLTNK